MEEDGLSLMDMWELILKKKIIGSIVFGIITIISLVLIMFVYNPLQAKYEAEFNYHWIGIEDNKYANGVVFNYYDIISLNNLKKVKESNVNYQNVKVEELAENIKIEVEEDRYIVRATGIYFKNDTQAKSFLEDLIYLPYKKALNLNFDFKANLVGYERVKKISGKLDYLDNQLNIVLKGYQDMISYFGDIEIDNTYLSSLYRNAEVFTTNKDLKEYKYIAYQNYYLTKEEYDSIIKEQDALKTEQNLLKERKEVLLDSLRNIYTNSNGNTYMDTSIANYLNSLHTLDSRLMTIDESLRLIAGATAGKYNEEQSKLFLDQLDEYKDELESLTLEYTNSVNKVLEENTFIYLQPIQSKGRIRFILAVLISVLIGIVCGLGVAFLVAFIESNKKVKQD
ncbi:MAG: hypothetical protein NC310_05525 [Roseburia sp.]|nr:hypothetical protein [Anaeroplasma bactoclasticum]MCM1196520.1 hypothetical protein [Roseburia sp.]MCM1557254.1 hypothetical protein [Anaeroplasma bactoclasticum]